MEKLKIAVQKSGRLSEKSVQLLTECGISLSNGNRRLVSVSGNFPVELLFLRDDDIPQYIADGVADIGIVGENVVLEKNRKVELVEKLGFARCRLSLAVPRQVNYTGLQWFNGKKIATSYPNILQKFLDENQLGAEIHEISGSVEIAPGIGLADAIFDIVSSGSTLISNGLSEVETALKSEAVIIQSPGLTEGKKLILENLLFRLRSVMKSRNHKYILLNAPNEHLDEIIEIIPGMKSPTIMPLAREGWSSVHSVLKEEEFWDVIGKLQEKGAQGILVIPIEKMII
ncbi:MAG TPA: ATP phosphoribosyltransferase [Bacteroidales bacterium]|nr:ATP phosphoribosyltransferase [Bacteroidales bacterium]